MEYIPPGRCSKLVEVPLISKKSSDFPFWGCCLTNDFESTLKQHGVFLFTPQKQCIETKHEMKLSYKLKYPEMEIIPEWLILTRLLLEFQFKSPIITDRWRGNKWQNTIMYWCFWFQSVHGQKTPKGHRVLLLKANLKGLHLHNVLQTVPTSTITFGGKDLGVLV